MGWWLKWLFEAERELAGIWTTPVLSLDGKTLLTNQYVAKKGAQVIDLDLPETRLKTGFYILQVQSDDQVYRQKIYKE